MKHIEYEATAVEGIALNDPQEKRVFTESDFAEVDRDELIFQLWRIIDNIDTFGDVAKSNDKAFRALTEKEQVKRWKHTRPEFIDFLYEKYYEKCCKNGSPQAPDSTATAQ